MQKLVTIYLTDSSESRDRDTHIKNNEIDEHLESYLSDGWKVINMCPVGTYSSGSFTGTSGFLSVVIEKN